MLHLRLPPPGFLRLVVRRMQESQRQAPDTRPQSIHVESASPRTCPRAGKGPAVRLSRRRAGRMRKAPWPMRCPQHHSRPLADRTHRARRSRFGPQRPATHARPVQALPRQQDRKDETFGLQQQTKPQLTHTGFGTKTKIPSKPSRRRQPLASNDTKDENDQVFSIRFATHRSIKRVKQKTIAKQTEANHQNTHGDTP